MSLGQSNKKGEHCVTSVLQVGILTICVPCFSLFYLLLGKNDRVEPLLPHCYQEAWVVFMFCVDGVLCSLFGVCLPSPGNA